MVRQCGARYKDAQGWAGVAVAVRSAWFRAPATTARRAPPRPSHTYTRAHTPAAHLQEVELGLERHADALLRATKQRGRRGTIGEMVVRWWGRPARDGKVNGGGAEVSVWVVGTVWVTREARARCRVGAVEATAAAFEACVAVCKAVADRARARAPVSPL